MYSSLLRRSPTLPDLLLLLHCPHISSKVLLIPPFSLAHLRLPTSRRQSTSANAHMLQPLLTACLRERRRIRSNQTISSRNCRSSPLRASSLPANRRRILTAIRWSRRCVPILFPPFVPPSRSLPHRRLASYSTPSQTAAVSSSATPARRDPRQKALSSSRCRQRRRQRKN